MKNLLKSYDFKYNIEYYNMVIDSYINGQFTQFINQFLELPKPERKEMVDSLINRYFAYPETTQKEIAIKLIDII